MSVFLNILLCNSTVSGVCGRQCFELDQCDIHLLVSLPDDTWIAYKTVKSTFVILFYLIVAPIIGTLLYFCWKVYESACDYCDDREYSKKSDAAAQNYKLKYECCKRNVAPILFPIPVDFDFKHHCGQNCLGPNKVQQPRYI